MSTSNQSTYRRTSNGLAIVIMFLLCDICIYSQQVRDKSDNTKSTSLLFRKETRPFHSVTLNRDMEIYISFPVSYFIKDTVFPVVFCADGNRSFDMISNVAHILSFPGTEIPEVFMVGIGYKLKGLEEWGAWRHRDLTPTNVPDADKSWQKTLSAMSGRTDLGVTSGGAADFLRFIQNELIPFVELNYRVSAKERTLMGYSLGGLFTLYALFQSPETFRRYFAGSPSIGWDKGVLFQYEKQYADAHSDLPVRLFLTAGALESESTINNLKELEDLLQSHHYPGLELERHIFENETHASCYAAAISRALRILYRKSSP